MIERSTVPKSLSKDDVGDWIFPSSNEFGIPDLLPSMQPRGLELPVNRWGATARKCRIENCTYHFYTDDYRFEGLWRDPTGPINAGARACVEPNFSTNGEMPRAVALWYVYAKRWLAKFWQTHGIEIWVDLAMTERYRDIALLGVPHEYKAYATYTYTKGYDDDWLYKQHEMAVKHSGDDIMLWVYGGEEHTEQLCRENGWLWTPAHQQSYLRPMSGKKVRELKMPKKIDSVGKHLEISNMTLERFAEVP